MFALCQRGVQSILHPPPSCIQLAELSRGRMPGGQAEADKSVVRKTNPARVWLCWCTLSTASSSSNQDIPRLPGSHSSSVLDKPQTSPCLRVQPIHTGGCTQQSTHTTYQPPLEIVRVLVLVSRFINPAK